jgi:hypothetical protein
MKAHTKAALIPLLFAASIVGAQSYSEDGGIRISTQVRLYWSDPSTGLVWAGNDSGKDVNWKQAAQYCHELSLAGYSTWRLPTIEELEGIYESGAKSPGEISRSSEHPAYAHNFAVKGALFLSGDPWSSGDIDDGTGEPAKNAWSFDFNQGSRIANELTLAIGKRALCVRRPDVVMSPLSPTEDQRMAQETQARGYWVDASTGLMWAGRDSGKDLTWGQARRYCRDLRLAGYPDWRLATLDELGSLVRKRASDTNQIGNVFIGGQRDVRGNLFLAGDSWSSNREIDRFGHPYGIGWFFDFRTSEPSFDLQLLRNTKRVLCVRRSGE